MDQSNQVPRVLRKDTTEGYLTLRRVWEISTSLLMLKRSPAKSSFIKRGGQTYLWGLAKPPRVVQIAYQKPAEEKPRCSLHIPGNK